MKSFKTHIAEKAEPLPRSKEVKIRPFDRKHKSVGLTVMFAKHNKHKAGDEAFDLTIMEPTGNRKYHGTVAKLKDEKGRNKTGWVAGVEGKRGKREGVGIGTTNSGNDLLAIRKAYEKAAKDMGTAPVSKSVKMISRGDALSRKI
jgi:hypothetical protein